MPGVGCSSVWHCILVNNHLDSDIIEQSRKRLQEAHGENKGYLEFTPPSRLQFPDPEYWQGENDYIRYNTGTCSEGNQRITVGAMTGKLEVPGFRCWRTCKRDNESIGDVPACVTPNHELDKVES